METAIDPSSLEQAAAAACRAGLRAGLREPEARDLAQEALVCALSSSRPPDGVPLAAWVYGIARNLGRDHLKSARSRELLVDTLPEHAGDEEDLATVLSVRRALHELPEPLRDVVTLHELEDHTLRETAAALAIPFDTAKDRLRRAREQLRAQLGDADAACGRERSHSRRRTVAAGAAIMAAVSAALGERAAAAASVAVGPAIVPASAGFVVRTWVAAIAGGALLAGGFAVGRFTAASPPRSSVDASAEVAAVREPAPRPAPASVRAPDLAPSSPPPAPPPPPPTTTTAPVATKPSRAEAPHGDTRPPPDAAIAAADHEAERLVIDRARAALQRGLPDEALVALMSHARQFPHGDLAEERDVLTIDAYLRANNAELARRAIERYRNAYPAGALRSRVAELTAQVP